jgi:hypothetical protein
MIFEVVNRTSFSVETHASKNIRLSLLRKLAPFLPPSKMGVIQEQFFMKMHRAILQQLKAVYI